MSCNDTDIDLLSNEINEIYYKFIRVQLFVGGLLLITTLTNMSMLSSIKTKLTELKNSIAPPLYKVVA
jgi:hypothetical protein